MLPKPTGLIARTALRPASTRCLSTSAARCWATPTNRYPPNDPRGGEPVEDIDVVFDYPSQGQVSHQKVPLERSGLDLHSAMPHHASAAAASAAMRAGQKAVPGGRMGKDVASPERNNVLYFGIGALGLGGLYMMMRPPRTEKAQQGQYGIGAAMHPGDLAAQQATEAKFRSGRAG